MKANSKKDLWELSVIIENLEGDARWKFLSHIHNLKLMKFNPQELEQVGVSSELFDKVVNNAEFTAYDILFSGIYKIMPDEITDMLHHTNIHVVFGQDTEDEDSVGGFSQREIDLIVNVIEEINDKSL